MVGHGLSFKYSGMDLDHKIWQSAHLWGRDGTVQDFSGPDLP